MGKKRVDTIIYKNVNFNEIAEECYLLVLELIQEKEVDHLHLVLDGNVQKPVVLKSKIKKLFSRKTAEEETESFYHPYETVNIPIEDLDLLPYSFQALLEEIKIQNQFFGDCHSFRISIYPSKHAHRSDDYNDLWIYTDILGENGRGLDKLNHIKNHTLTNFNCNLTVKIPAAYESEFLKLEHNLYKGAKKS
jgi:hypothetical protein